ncbi:hypothetical protein NMY22_g9878 [Coprinellus aureogranulatus]|nr:hypothetical protein NMY22_g9878 [Coprinellus aureogranulatus]
MALPHRWGTPDTSKLSPEALKANPKLLLHRALDDTVPNELTFKAAALVEDGFFFVASVNVPWIPELPPTGSREVYQREDLRYGTDDYIQWPQPGGYPHFSAIPRNPMTPGPNEILWKKYHRTHQSFLETTSHFVTLAPTDLADFEKVYSQLANEVNAYLQLPGSNTPSRTNTLFLFGKASRELWRCVVELQRFMLELRASLDWGTTFLPRIQGLDHPATSVAETLGTFTSDPNIVRQCVTAGVPVWVFQDIRSLPHTRIDSVVDFEKAEGRIVMDEGVRKHETIFKGKATNIQRLENIYLNSRLVLHTADIFASNLNPPPARSDTPRSLNNAHANVSSHLGIQVSYHPYQTSKLTAERRSNVLTNLITKPTISDAFPSVLPSWLTAIESVNLTRLQQIFPASIPSDAGFAFPNVNVFHDAVNGIKKPMLYRWMQLRMVMLFRIGPSVASMLSSPMSNRVWRRSLQLDPSAFNSIRSATSNNKSWEEKRAALAFLESAVQAAGESPEPLLRRSPSWRGNIIQGPNDMSERVVKEVVWELSELNFRFELLALDRRLSTVPTSTAAQCAERHDLLLDCLIPIPLARAFTIVEFDQATRGLAHPEIRQRLPQLLHLRTLMLGWRTPFTGFAQVDGVSATRELERMEEAIYTFYVEQFIITFWTTPEAREEGAKAEAVLASASRGPQATSKVVGDNRPGSTTTSSLPVPRPAPPLKTAHHQPPAPEATGSGTKPSVSAQDESNPFADFEARKQDVVDALFQRYTAKGLGGDCRCGSGAMRTTVCHECWNYEPSCSNCFVDSHIRVPTHWAHVWHPDRGYFVQHDISALPNHPAIHLGHGGLRCPRTPKDSMQDVKEVFIIVDVNGIHSTKLRFCGCADGTPDRVCQLLRAQLLPATYRRPRLAFTFAVMQNFHIHHLTSAESAYDYIAALRHLTDEFFFKDAADPYDAFLDAYKIWRIIDAEITMGWYHKFNDFFPHRRSGSLSVRCPACVEFGVNTSKEEEHVCDPRLRHIFQILGTLDANYQANRYIKNTDPRRISFFAGRAFFPPDAPFRVFVVKVNASKTPEKTTCAYLKAINKQDKSKFAGTDVSGIANFQCPHVFILSTVDLQFGERYPVVDYAIAHGLAQRNIAELIAEYPNLDFGLSYDIGCSFGVNAVSRFKEHSPEQPGLPSARDTSMGRQMCNGNRQDLITGAMIQWNRGKEAGLPSQLHSDLMKAEALKSEKQEIFVRYCTVNKSKLPEWNALSRVVDPKNRDKKGEVLCVYRHTPSKLPSQKRIYDTLLQHAEEPTSPARFTKKPKAAPQLLNDSIRIRRLQQKILCTLASIAKLGVGPERSETTVQSMRTQLQQSLKRFRELQLKVTPQVADEIPKLDDTSVYDEPELQHLFLPSYYEERDRLAMGLVELGQMERDILEGAAYDTLSKIRTAVQMLGALHSSDKNDRGQTQHTRNRNIIENSHLKVQIEMAAYTNFRDALLKLGFSKDDPTLLPMNENAIKRKSTTTKRALGDTSLRDGHIWTSGSINAHKRLVYKPLVNTQDSSLANMVGTQSSQGRKRKNDVSAKDDTVASSSKKPRVEAEQEPDSSDSSDWEDEPDESNGDDVSMQSPPTSSQGWLWNVKGGSKGLTDGEVEAFLSEGARVQWFRAEADMMRWQEEWERKLVDFMRSIRYYDKVATVWRELSLRSDFSPGMIALARKTSNRYLELRRRCQDAFKQAGYEYILPDMDPDSGVGASEGARITTHQQAPVASVGDVERETAPMGDAIPGAASSSISQGSDQPPSIVSSANVGHGVTGFRLVLPFTRSYIERDGINMPNQPSPRKTNGLRSELNFRHELFALDRHICTLPNPDSFERRELILDCLVPPRFPCAFLVIVPHQASSGLGHSEIRQRVPQPSPEADASLERAVYSL